MKFEKLVMTDDVPKRLFVATVNALHSMVVVGVFLEPETVIKLRSIATTGDASSMECIHDLLDFLDNKRILSIPASFLSNSLVKKELTARQNTSVSCLEEESIEPAANFHSLNHLLGTTSHLDRSFNVPLEPHEVCSGPNQAWYRTTL